MLVILVTLPIFAGILGFGFIMLFDLVTPEAITQHQRFSWLVVAFVLSSVAMFFALRSVGDKYYWELRDGALFGGRKQRVKIELNEIDTIVIGLPVRTGFKLSNHLEAMHKDALFIKLVDNEFMIFNIHSSQNGTALMNRLLDECEDKLASGYEYSTRECKIIHPPKWNTIVRDFT